MTLFSRANMIVYVRYVFRKELNSGKNRFLKKGQFQEIKSLSSQKYFDKDARK